MTDGATGQAPPPGWYDDPTGAVRWWDGAQWSEQAASPAWAPPAPGPGGVPGPGGYGSGAPYGAPGYGMPGYGGPGYGMPGPGRADARTMALFAHLGVFVGGFVVPLIIYLTVAKDDPFIRHHSSEALNFSLTYLLFTVVCMVVGFATLFLAFVVLLPLMLIAAVGHIAYSVMGAMASSRGEWWRYPISIRFVQGAV